MATYAIGDVQGCFAELQKLLMHIEFNPAEDILWFTGDLVNRGPRSLDVLRFVKDLGSKHITVLGNHDLHLLAVAYGTQTTHQSDTLDDILKAPDKIELMDWLRTRPLLHVDHATSFVMTHAGLAPFWTLHQAKQYAQEVEMALRNDTPDLLLQHIYGNQPDLWNEELTGIERLRCIINYFTRMRFCHADGRLDLTYKGDIAGKPQDVMPWFDVPHRVNENQKIIFGHWAGLGGKTDTPNVYPLDTGCVWGNALTAMRLEDEKRFSVGCGA
jgi:bis(5'-nucleosyl)-tetraphosphatase (symmetrical)